MRFALAIALILVVGVANAWTFHGDVQRTGNFTSAVKSGELVYKIHLTGFIDGSPVVYKGTVFVMNNPSMNPSNDELGLYIINATNGTILKYVSGFYGMATPTVYKDLVFVHAYNNGRGYLYCLYLNGTLKWRREIEDNISWWLVSSSPLVYDNYVYVRGYNTNLYKFDLNGNEIWKVSVEAVRNYHTSPSAYKGMIFFAKNDTCLCAYYENGTKAWCAVLEGNITNTPAIAYDNVYIATDKKLYALYLNGSVHWSIPFKGSLSTPAIAYGKIYIGSKDGKFYCFYANNGSEVWNFTAIRNPSAWDSIQSSPAYADGYVYFATNTANGTIFALNASDGSLVWKYEVKQYVMSSPFLWRNKLYIGADDGNIYIFGIWKGDVYLTPGNFTVVADNGKTYVVDNLTALGALNEASRIGGFSYTVNETYGGGNLYPTSIGGISEGWWCYEVNGIMPSNGTNKYPVKDGDTVVYWLWKSNGDSVENSPNEVIIRVHMKDARINSLTVSNAKLGGNATAYVNVTSFADNWYVVVVSGLNDKGDYIAGISTFYLSKGQSLRVPVLIHAPQRNTAGTYKLYAGIYRLKDYPNKLIDWFGAVNCEVSS